MKSDERMPGATTTDAILPVSSAPRRIGPELRGRARARHLVGRALAAETAGWRSMGRAIAFRPRVPEGASAHAYDKPFRTVLVIFLVLSIVEVVVLDLITRPWPAVWWPLLVLGIWGVLTMTGMLSSYYTRPHAVGPAGIRVRHGGEVDIDLPWDAIESVARCRRSLTGAPALSLTGSGDDVVLNHVAQDGTDIDIVLERPTSIRLPQGDVTVATVRISVDDTDAFLDAVRAHIP
jgi:hypothetical protein